MVAVAARCFALGAAVALLAGCGGSSSARTQARAINLRPGDLPGSTATQVREQHVRAGPLGEAAERCDGGLTASRDVVSYSSPRFARRERRRQAQSGPVEVTAPRHSAEAAPASQPTYSSIREPFESVHSVVYVFGSEAAALRELAALSSARARVCVEQGQKEARTIGGSSGGAASDDQKSLSAAAETHVEVTPIPTSLGGPSFGLRSSGETSSLFALRPPARIYGDSLGFVTGRALVVLDTTSEQRPPPAALEGRLLSLLHSRAQAHRL